MTKTMTLAEARKQYPKDSLVRIVRTDQLAYVNDHYSTVVPFVGRRVFVGLTDCEYPLRHLSDRTTDEIEATS